MENIKVEEIMKSIKLNSNLESELEINEISSDFGDLIDKLNILSNTYNVTYYFDLGQNKPKKFLKRIIKKIIKPILFPLINQQNNINKNIVDFLIETKSFFVHEAKLIENLIKENDDLKDTIKNLTNNLE